MPLGHLILALLGFKRIMCRTFFQRIFWAILGMAIGWAVGQDYVSPSRSHSRWFSSSPVSGLVR